MADDPTPEPFEWGARYGDLLQTGRMLAEALRTSEHYTAAMRMIEFLSHRDLAYLALYVAADAQAATAQATANGDAWLQWWWGIDDSAADIETTPAQLWRIVRRDS